STLATAWPSRTDRARSRGRSPPRRGPTPIRQPAGGRGRVALPGRRGAWDAARRGGGRVTELRWGERTYVMGIVNVTPDSFSGDGIATDGRTGAEIVAVAVDQARGFVVAGAQLLDVGGESSRPAQFYGEHPPVSAEQEAARVIPVVAALASELGDRAAVSIDTT